MASGTRQALCAFLSTSGASPCGGAFAPGCEDRSTSHSVSLLVVGAYPRSCGAASHTPQASLPHTTATGGTGNPPVWPRPAPQKRPGRLLSSSPPTKQEGHEPPRASRGPQLGSGPLGTPPGLQAQPAEDISWGGPPPSPGPRTHTEGSSRRGPGFALLPLSFHPRPARGPARPLSAPRLRLPHGRPARLPGPRGSGAEVKAGGKADGEPGGRRAGRAGGRGAG